MLTRIDLRHFKCFDLLKLPLRPLTLLSGPNSSGKSSVLQAIALLSQTVREQERGTQLMLNGSSIQLGTAGNVIDKTSGGRHCDMSLQDDETTYRWQFEGEHTETSMAVKRVSIGDFEVTGPETLRHLLPTPVGGSLLASCLFGTYLPADRLNPLEAHPGVTAELTTAFDSPREGVISTPYPGAAQYVPDGLTLADAPPERLRQVEARMSRLFPDSEVTTNEIPDSSTVPSGDRTVKATDIRCLKHAGLGINQALPIVVAALSTRPGGLLLIENPELNLHPAGQATMGEFLAEVAAAGVQVILETHSDHVLNGVRRAIKDGILAPDNAALHFFRTRQDAERHSAARVQSPLLDNDGNIDYWPEGFFDQFDRDMSYFAGWAELTTCPPKIA